MEIPPGRVALVVDDHALTRTLLCETLAHAGFVAVPMADAHGALVEFRGIDPDVLVADVDLGEPPNGVELATALTAIAPHLAVVLLSNYGSADRVPGGASLPHGSVFLRKADLDSTSVLLDAVEAALREQPERVPGSAGGRSPMEHLTARQLVVLRRMAEGWSNAEIAEREGVSVGALEKITTRIFTTLGLRDDARLNPRVAATRAYIEEFGPPRSATSR